MSEFLIVFPSFATDQSFYKKLIQSAPPNWEVLVMDYKDLTKSGNFDDFEEKVLNFLDKHQLKDATLLGFSLGGILALKFSHKYPSRVRRLFLIDSAGFYVATTYYKLLINACLANTVFFSHQPTRLLKLIINMLSKPVWYKRQLSFGKNMDLSKDAGEIRIPTTIFWGEKDRLIPLSQGQKLHQLIPNSKLVVLKDKNHDWILNDPELFWKEV